MKPFVEDICIGYTGWLVVAAAAAGRAGVLIYMTIFSSLSYCINPSTHDDEDSYCTSQQQRTTQQLASDQSWSGRRPGV